ncbi:hypothetical protein, partial [Vibrio anguillarum]|uniref:hypothetical protein n=1 Tax=Vibrio anguillarum TaxID=55601 RepID=UPI00188CC803
RWSRRIYGTGWQRNDRHADLIWYRNRSIPLYVNDEPITDIQRLSQFHYTNGNPLMTRITMASSLKATKPLFQRAHA